MARCLLLFVTLAWSGPAWSQSLGEAAKKEKERRAAGKKAPAPSYTQDDLKSGSGPAPESSPGAPAPGARSAPSGKARPPEGEPSQPTPSAEEESTDARYRRLAAPLRSRLADCQYWLARREKRLKEAEEAEWRAGPRLPYRDYYGREVERAKKALEDQKRECDDIEDEARRAGIPAGYLR